MNQEKANTRLYAISLALIVGAAIFGIFNFISLIVKLLPFIIFITPIFYFQRIIALLKRKKKSEKIQSESIFQKRLKRFKSIKRGYYSLIALGIVYLISLLGPLWMNNKPLIVSFANQKYDEGEKFTDTDNKNGVYDQGEEFIDSIGNGIWDKGEEFVDLNSNGVWNEGEPFVDLGNDVYDEGEEFVDSNIFNGIYDEGEPFEDQRRYYFPAIKDFFSFIPGVPEARYSGKLFNQDNSAVVDFRKLNETLSSSNSNDYIIMPLYPYHPHEDLSDQLDEKFTDINNNNEWDEGYGTLLQLNVKGKISELTNIIVTNSNGENLNFNYYKPKDKFKIYRRAQQILISQVSQLIGENISFDVNLIKPQIDSGEFINSGDDIDDFSFYVNDSNKILYNSSENISSFQFDIIGAELVDFSKVNDKGDAGKANFILSVSNQTVTGISNGNLIHTQEPFEDENNNGKYDVYNPPIKPGDSPRHILGTETSGKDVFTRLVDGYKISITFAIIVTTLSYILGVIIGAILGYYGGKWDLFGVRIIEIFSSIPFLFVLMILAGFMKPGVFLLALLVVILTGWIGITMYIRGEFFREKPKDYVSAAVSMGQSSSKIMFKHILPNSLTPIITFAPFSIIGNIGTLVSLDFLGYGLKPPASSWGALLKQGSENLMEWHLLVFPVLAMTITIFMITWISEAVREAFDPRVYSRLR